MPSTKPRSVGVVVPLMSDHTKTGALTPPAPASHRDRAADAAGGQRAGVDEDGTLVRRLRAGDEAAFTAFVERYHGALLRLALVFVSSHGVAEEVVQETWAGVLKGLPSFEGRSSLKTWIFRILSNRAKTRGVREGRTVPFSSLGDADADSEPAVPPERFQDNGRWDQPPTPWDAASADRLLAQKQAVERLVEALDELPASQRAVVTLRDVEGIESHEICRILQISEANQRVILHRGRSKLRRILEQYFEGA